VCQSTGCEPAPGRPEDPYMAQAGSPQGLRLPVSGRGQGSGIFSVGEAESSLR